MTPFVTVATVYDQSQLALLLSLLEDADIWVVPTSRGHASVQWEWTLALGGVELRVRQEDADSARQLLGRLEPVTIGRPIFSDNCWIEALFILALFAIGLFGRRPGSTPSSTSIVRPPRLDERNRLRPRPT